MEQWKAIKGYEGLYEVSNMGNVRSLNWRNTGESKNLYLKPHNRGYLQVELWKNGERRTFTVHKLVALHFVDGYRDDFVVNHKNEIKTDNRAENLEWCSFSDNVRYSYVPGRNSGRHGKRRKGAGRKRNKAIKCVIPVSQLGPDGTEIKRWESPVAIKNALGFSDWSIKQCCLGKRKQAYGYMWQYAT